MAVIQGACAAFVAHRFEAPRWWVLIHLLFFPLVVLALAAQVPPAWYLGAFVFTLLVFWRTDKSRVPLYLSNALTAAEVAKLLPTLPCRVLDVGCGDARLLRALAEARPDCLFVGIEHAPATWLWAKLRSSRIENIEIRYGNFWKMDWTAYSVVYAFLSPVPMAEVWQKAQAELQQGSLLISNSFVVPEQTPQQLVAVADSRETQLYCYYPAN